MDDTGQEGRSEDQFEKLVTVKISRLANKLNAQSAHLLQAHSDLKLVEWRILRRLQAMGRGSSVMHLAEAVLIDKGQLSRSVKAMAAKGLLTVTEDASDHRTHFVAMTDAGRQAVESVTQHTERRHAFLIAGFPEGDYEIFLQILETISERADARDFPDPTC